MLVARDDRGAKCTVKEPPTASDVERFTLRTEHHGDDFGVTGQPQHGACVEQLPVDALAEAR